MPDPRMPKPKDPNNLFKRMPARAQALFLAGVFFLFAPLVPLQFIPGEGTRLTGILIPFIVSGLIGAAWAATGTLSKKIYPLAILLTLCPIFGFLLFKSGWFWIKAGSINTAGLGATVSIALGYALFIIFIALVGKDAIRLETEMALAKSIHDRLVPELDLNTPRYQIFARSTASSEMGGDMVCTAHHENSTDAIVADVSGHGVAAGVVMAMIRAIVESSANAPERPIQDLVAQLNTVLHDLTDHNMFATLAAVRLTNDKHPLCVIAGHPPALIFRAGDATPERIDSAALPTGVLQHTPFEPTRFTLNPGDLLAIYTDGVIETKPEPRPKDAPLDLFGIDRLESVIAETRAAPLSQIAESITTAARAHGPQTDDETILLIRATV